jgi:hypothetical protein
LEQCVHSPFSICPAGADRRLWEQLLDAEPDLEEQDDEEEEEGAVQAVKVRYLTPLLSCGTS